jgi:hypothetical protein
MQNEPNFSKSQMLITLAATKNCNEKVELDTWSKRTQTKPIKPNFYPKQSQNEPKGSDIYPVFYTFMPTTILSTAAGPPVKYGESVIRLDRILSLLCCKTSRNRADKEDFGHFKCRGGIFG